jgi:hypothetical protein
VDAGPAADVPRRHVEPAHDAGAQHEPRQLRIGAADVFLLHLEVRDGEGLAGVVAVAARRVKRREAPVVGAGGGHVSSLRVSRIDARTGAKHDEPPRPGCDRRVCGDLPDGRRVRPREIDAELSFTQAFASVIAARPA